MGEQKRSKKTIWVYAVVLFTSAFIVLLLTAYSQIKFNKNINDYRAELSSKEKEKLNFELNLNNALDENKKIKAELEELKKSIADRQSSKENSDKELENLKNEKDKMQQSYEMLISAENQYQKGNIIESAKILVKQCDSSLLQKEAQEKYNELYGKTVEKAARMLYIDGYTKFRNKKYSDAIDSFMLSNELDPNEYYSDDCLYFAAYSQYYLGNNDAANNLADKLVQNYPNSNFINDLQNLLN